MNIKLKARIVELGYIQYKLAERLGIRPRRFSGIVCGHIAPTDIEQEQIEQALDAKNLFKRKRSLVAKEFR